MTVDGGGEFELTSFRLSNFTFNASHTHGMDVTFNYADTTSETISYTVGTEIPGARLSESADIVVNKSNLTSVEFASIQRLVYVDDIVAKIPEPTALALTSLASLGLLSTRRRRRD